MNKSNLPPFYIGQKVVYIPPSSSGSPQNNKTYTVLQTHLQQCGCWAVDIQGFIHNRVTPPQHVELMCGVCKKNTQYAESITSDTHAETWLWSGDLRPAEEMKPPLMTFEKIKEKEAEKPKEESEILTLN